MSDAKLQFSVSITPIEKDFEVTVGCQHGRIDRATAQALVNELQAQLAIPPAEPEPKHIWLFSEYTSQGRGSGQWYGPYKSVSSPDPKDVHRRDVQTVSTDGHLGGLCGPVTKIHVGPRFPG